jgi:hypothetical protein
MNRIARLAPAAVLTAAVVVSASAGGAVAAKMVTGKDIKDGTVTAADVKNGSLTGKDVKTGSIGAADLGTGVRKKLDKPNVVGYQVVTETVSIPTAGQGQAIAFCPAGKVAVTGGAQWEAGALETSASLQESYPGKAIGEFFAPLESGDVATAWKVSGEHNNLDPVDFTAYVVCMSPA